MSSCVRSFSAMPPVEHAMADDIDDVDAMLEDVFNKKVRARLNIIIEKKLIMRDYSTHYMYKLLFNPQALLHYEPGVNF